MCFSKDYKGLLNDFSFRLSQASESKPLMIFLGCLDRLSGILNQYYHRPQRICGKVIFSQASVSHSVQGGCIPACTGADTPQADTPPGRHPPGHPWADTPQGRHPPGRQPPRQTPQADNLGQGSPPSRLPLGRHPQADNPPGQTHPLSSACWDTQTPAQYMLGYTPFIPMCMLGYTPLHPVATAADGTHPTGIHTCLFSKCPMRSLASRPSEAYQL